jgi:hypothetical protein
VKVVNFFNATDAARVVNVHCSKQQLKREKGKKNVSKEGATTEQETHWIRLCLVSVEL